MDTVLSGSADTGGGVASANTRLAHAPLDYKRLEASAGQLVRGLAMLHGSGNLHRDIKPSNIMVERGGRIVVCDFGLVSGLSGDSSGERRIEGTPPYMSPEQASRDQLTRASDWYSVGCVFYQALTGRLPFHGNAYEQLQARLSAEPPEPRHLVPDIPERWNDLTVALLRRDPNQRPGSREILERLGDSAPAVELTASLEADDIPFVGRTRELALLRDALDRVSAGHAVVSFVHGQSGMGKSSLIERFLEQASEDDRVLLFRGRCYERESVPYKSLDSLIDSLSRYLGGLVPEQLERVLPRDFAALEHIFPVLRSVRPEQAEAGKADLPRDPQEIRQRAFAALRVLFASLAQSKTVILYIDDMQWGDVDSAPFFAELSHHPSSSPIMLVGSYRDEARDASALLNEMLDAQVMARATCEYVDVPVGSLTDEDARNLAGRLIGRSADRVEQVEWVAREASGSPLFVAELARSDAQHDGRRMGLDDLIAARIEKLPDDARALLTLCAVSGRPIGLGLISRAANVHDEPAALALLAARRLIRSSQTQAGELIETYHDRVRETVTTRLPDKQLHRWHRRVARALESEAVNDAQALALHWLAAGDNERAGSYSIRAAQEAAATAAFSQASEHYQRALDVMELSEEQSLELRVQLGDLLTLAGRVGSAADVYLEAADGADARLALELKRRALQAMLRAGRLEQGLQLSEELLAAIGMKLPKSSGAAIATILWGSLKLKLRRRSFVERAAEDIAAERLWAVDLLHSMAEGLNTFNTLLGRALSTRFELLALQTGELSRVGLALSISATYRAVMLGAKVEAEVDTSLATAKDACERSDSTYARATYYYAESTSNFCMGNYPKALESGDRSVKMFTDEMLGDPFMAAQARVFQLSALCQLGQYKRLVKLTLLALARALQSGDEFLVRTLRSWRTNIAWMLKDDIETARAHLDEASSVHTTKLFTVRSMYEVWNRTQLDLYAGQSQRAFRQMTTNWKALTKSLPWRLQTVRIETHLLRARAGIAAAAHDSTLREHGLTTAQRSIDAIHKESAASGVAAATLLGACIANIRGDQDSTLRQLDDANARLTERHMEGVAVTARMRKGQLLGGTEGRDLIDAGVHWMSEQDVVEPNRLANVFAPGFDEHG